MYDAFDSFIRVGTWQTRQPSDQESATDLTTANPGSVDIRRNPSRLGLVSSLAGNRAASTNSKVVGELEIDGLAPSSSPTPGGIVGYSNVGQ